MYIMEAKRKQIRDKFRNLKSGAEMKGMKAEEIKQTLIATGAQSAPSKQSGLECDSGKIVSLLRLDSKPALKVRQVLRKHLLKVFLVVGVVSAVGGYFFKETLIEALGIREERCVLNNNNFVMEVARPILNCNMCAGVTRIPIETDMTSEVFIRKFAYSGIPVLIKGAIANWTAMGTFSFQFFKKLYTETEGALDAVENECQFFPYKTDFDTLGDMFNMSEARANFSEGEKTWYVGWSNCDSTVGKILREHYQRPFFLPQDSESSMLDWIFMGGTGQGAFVHLDFVERPSWQAQISGKKSWRIIPVPECETVCTEMNVTVHKGDIFVFDSNLWYHSTKVEPGEISITIGSEYD
ncbi:uncharacterized protein LOC127868144 isoform X1 [Dreissena polymorpha]|uniref:uncharacterized protein LOC127868144 isoform X1 n=1 Tax=Dreissena polymorpha TaxID=45954 RepID=UPI0022655103|nr:uncharacterized protein LOC127868144 isoform X1 [Dreissena polymorpha]